MSAAVAAPRLTVAAGPLTAELELPDVRYVRFGGVELVRRITVPVRDAVWDTVPAVVRDIHIEQSADRFTVGFNARNTGREIDIAWAGRISGGPGAELRYEAEGSAGADGFYRRVGICVLHPIAGCAGSRFGAVGDEPITGTLPDLAGPQLLDGDEARPLFPRFVELTVSIDGIPVRHVFEGDFFEMEDQRNWADASFKTYSTSPQARREPWPLRKGARFRQAVSVTADTTATPRRRNIDPAEPPRLTPAAEPGELPRVGLGSGAPLRGDDIPLLRALAPSHLRVDVDPGQGDWHDRLELAATEANELGCQLEVALIFGDDPAADVRVVAEKIAGLPMAHLLVLPGQPTVTPEGVLALARELLLPQVRGLLVGGTNANFCELNRERRPLRDADALVYSVNPQVHAYDDLSLMETPAAVGETVRAAHALAAGRPVIVSPITLRPRFNPDAPAELSGPPDPRQSEPIAGAWTLAVVAALIRGRAHSATFFETKGPRGVVGDGGPFPVYTVLSRLAELAEPGSEVVDLECTQPLRCAGVRFSTPAGAYALIASLLPTPQPVLVDGVAEEIELGPYEVAKVPLGGSR